MTIQTIVTRPLSYLYWVWEDRLWYIPKLFIEEPGFLDLMSTMETENYLKKLQ